MVIEQSRPAVVNRSRTDNTMAKNKNGKKTNNNLQKHYRETKIKFTPIRFPLKMRCELRYPGRVNSSCSNSGTRRFTLDTNRVISHEWGRDLTRREPYPWSFWHIYSVTVNQVMMATEILTRTTSSGISDQLKDIYSIYRCCWDVATCKWKIHNGKIEIISFVIKLRS